MKTLYLDCGMGAAGDMLTAALMELTDDPDGFVAELNALGLPGVEYRREAATTCGIAGARMVVTVDGVEEAPGGLPIHAHAHHYGVSDGAPDEHDHAHAHHHAESCGTSDGMSDGASHAHAHADGHHHASLHDIEHLVRDHLAVPDRVRNDVLAVYGLIAEAESRAHGMPIEDIHFHEVGTMDAIADVTAVCLLMDRLAPDEVVVSPINVGGGQVVCAHGILPVPAPATAYILQDVPFYGGDVQTELCTPTGAALVKHFATRFGSMPVMRVRSIGYGIGTKRLDRANCVRAFWGETDEGTNDVVATLSCTVDDMTAEDIGYAMDLLLAEGAVEVYTMPVGMKKSRPGTLLVVMCREADRDRIAGLVFKHTTTIGIRESLERRYTLDRAIEEVETPTGTVRKKVSSGYGVRKEKLEYDDIARIARATGLSLAEVRRGVM